MDVNVNVYVEIENINYSMDRNAAPTEGCIIMIINADSSDNYSNLDVFKVKAVNYDNRFHNNIKSVEVEDLPYYCSTISYSEFAVLVPVSN